MHEHFWGRRTGQQHKGIKASTSSSPGSEIRSVAIAGGTLRALSREAVWESVLRRNCDSRILRSASGYLYLVGFAFSLIISPAWREAASQSERKRDRERWKRMTESFVMRNEIFKTENLEPPRAGEPHRSWAWNRDYNNRLAEPALFTPSHTRATGVTPRHTPRDADGTNRDGRRIHKKLVRIFSRLIYLFS